MKQVRENKKEDRIVKPCMLDVVQSRANSLKAVDQECAKLKGGVGLTTGPAPYRLTVLISQLAEAEIGKTNMRDTLEVKEEAEGMDVEEMGKQASGIYLGQPHDKGFVRWLVVMRGFWFHPLVAGLAG